MSMKFQSSAARYIILIFVVAIIGSFALSGIGLDGSGMFSTAPDSVANVDGTPISIREYQMAVSQQAKFYSQMMGGKDLTNKQMEQFGVKKAALDRLIQSKLMLNLANEMDIKVADSELKEEIKNLPYFKTGENFDVNKYKSLLSANGFSPSSFEKTIGDDVKVRRISGLFNNIQASSKLAEDIARFKAQTTTINGIEIEKRKLFKYVTVSNSEINAYLKDEKNLKKTEALYKQKKSTYEKPEQVQAKHILIKTDTRTEKEALAKAKSLRKKLTTKNFTALANKNTEDPSGKNKGGDLGWFTKGRMVKEFENTAFNQKVGTISDPVKTNFGYHIIYVTGKKKGSKTSFDKVKNELAKEQIQKTKAKELDILFNKIIADLENNFKKGNIKANEKLAKKYELKKVMNQKINFYDFNPGGLTITSEEAQKAISGNEKVKILKNPSETIVLHIKDKATDTEIAEAAKKNVETEKTAMSQVLSRSITNDIIEKKREQANITTNSRLL